MKYCDIEDVKKESGMDGNKEIADRDVQDFIDTAQSIVNGSLYGKYALPFDDQPNTPQLIERITRGIASAYLLMQEYGPMNTGDAKDGDAKEKLMMKMLEKLQKGGMVVVDNSGTSLLPTDKTSASGNPNDSNSNSDGTQYENTGGLDDSYNKHQGPYIKMDTKW